MKLNNMINLMKHKAGIIALGFITFFIIASLFTASYYSKHKRWCKNFKTQSHAQSYMEDHGANHLDGDKDGIACENNKP